MSTFLPNVPQPADDLDVSQGDLLGNFQALDAVFLQNHYTFSDGTINKGKHRVIETPFIAASAVPTTTVDPIIYGHQYTVPSGILQFSKPAADGVATPLTSLQSPATAIVLAAGVPTNVMDFAGLTRAWGLLYGKSNVSDVLSFFRWNGASLVVTNIVGGNIADLKPQVSGTTLQLVNTGSASNVFWTLEFARIE